MADDWSDVDGPPASPGFRSIPVYPLGDEGEREAIRRIVMLLDQVMREDAAARQAASVANRKRTMARKTMRGTSTRRAS